MSSGAGITFRNNIEWLAEQYNESRMGSSMFSYLMGYEDPRLSAYFKPVDDKCTLGQLAFDGKNIKPFLPASLRQNDVYTTFSSRISKVTLRPIGCVLPKSISYVLKLLWCGR